MLINGKHSQKTAYGQSKLFLFTPNSPLADTQYKDETYFYGNNKNINRQRAHH